MYEEIVFEEKYSKSLQDLRSIVGKKDKYTLGHLDRVSELSVLIGKKMGLADSELQALKIGGLCHDIGKLEVDDSILFKETCLSDEEYSIIKRHPVTGSEMLEEKGILKNIIPIIKYHHERYDGKGYPENLAGEQIPLLARITSVADAFDAMSSKRSYNNIMNMEDIKKELENNKGTQFDPIATDAFLDILENDIVKVREIQRTYM